ncbi:hypothetical protein BDB00DRAFT_115308 [Zychaea mexicana]|uniref:uncharacterized protein n=1 Tax=Zychaea mexicana TaxID=64656 RepID=UPI0022FEA818|nr:uncharacterized protein BDB00DRAFT_115308 [Zychaea mexicana]KAI9484741.1 hypothetical protein BDB00DRAFT_115308 [Zychaea mexicana]
MIALSLVNFHHPSLKKAHLRQLLRFRMLQMVSTGNLFMSFFFLSNNSSLWFSSYFVESNAPSSSSPGATTPTSLNNTSFIYSPTAILSDVASPIGIVTENDVLTSQQRQHNHRRRGSSSSGRHSNGNSSNTKSSSKTTRAATTTAIAPIKTTAAATKRISKEEYYSYYYDGSIDQLFESCFFSAVLLLQWSNVMGPKMVKVWSSADDEAAMDEKLQTLIGRQVLNGEMGRSISEDGGGVELKWITLHRQGILCAAFLYNDRNNGGSSGSSALSALVFILPLRYLRNFSPYFHVLRDRVPLLLIQPLKQIRKLSRRRNISGSTALDFFARRCLAPFIQSIMEIESVSLPLECNKISYNLLDQESRQLFDSPFFGR